MLFITINTNLATLFKKLKLKWCITMNSAKTELYGSDLILNELKECGIDFVAINPGSSIGGLQDSMVHSEDYPKMILCLHEEIAVAVAHGYTKASGKIMAVALHANVGLLHSSMAIFNAWCDRAPVLIIGGYGPILPEDRRPWIDWIHSSSHQAGLVSSYVKWYDTPLSIQSCLDSIRRGIDIASFAPKAPVYIGISSSLQEMQVHDLHLLENVVRNKQPNTPTARQEDYAKLANLIDQSQFPVIVVDYFDAREEMSDALIRFAEELGIPVLDLGGRYNFPSDNLLSLTGGEEETISKADLVILIDVQDPYGSLGKFDPAIRAYVSYLQPGTRTVSLGMRDFLISSAFADYHKLVNFSHIIRADSSSTLYSTLDYLKKEIGIDPARLNERISVFQGLRKTLKSKWESESTANNEDALNIPKAISAIWQTVRDYDFILSNCGGLSIRAWVKKLWEFDDIHRSFVGINSGGAGLGYGLGASIGAALATKEKHKLCINIQNDGDLLYTPSALWTIAHYKLSMLIILMNNQSYALTKAVSKKVAIARKRQNPDIATGNCFNHPVIDYQAMAKSYGISHSNPITSKQELVSEITKAIAYIGTNNEPYLIDLRIED